jgi:8-oxo-dGTP pyrophosphatase MutT (NUDIX family)
MSRLEDLTALLRSVDDQPDERRRMLELGSVPGDPMARDHFDPGHFTSSGFVLSPDRTELLLVHHRRLDRWLQPGGHIDPGDVSVEEAARREVVEETGVALVAGFEAVIDLDVHPILAGNGEPHHKHFDVRFLYVAADTILTIDRSEVNDAAWFALGDIVDGSGDPSVRRVAAKLAARLA